MDILTLKSKDKLGCNLCDKCCIYRGDIRLTPVNVCEIAKYMGLTNKEFVEKYTDRVEGDLFELVLKTRGCNRQCILYDEIGKKCSIHKVKPLQCVMFPLYPENIKQNFFINSGQCTNSEFKTITIDKWLNGNGNIYNKHKNFCLYWISFIEDVQDIFRRKEIEIDQEFIYKKLFLDYDMNWSKFEKQARKNIEEIKELIKIKI